MPTSPLSNTIPFNFGCMLPCCSCRLQNMDPEEQVPPSALAVPPPHIGGATTPWAAAMDPDADVPPLVPAVPPPPVGGHGNTSLPPPLSPMVLRVLPLWGSSASIGFIYDATPDPDGGLLAAALAFFSHQGHQVFHNPCPDLAEYCQAMGVSALAVVSVDRLPDHLLSLCLELMSVLRAPSPTDAKFMGMMFTAAYLLPTASAPLWLGALKLVRQWGVFWFLHWRRLGETLLRLSVLKSVCLWGVLTLAHLWGVLRFLFWLRLLLIPAISPPCVGPRHFSSRGIRLLPRHLPSGTPT